MRILKNPFLIGLSILIPTALRSQVVFTDNFGTSNISSLPSYNGPAGAYAETSNEPGNTVDIRTSNPSPDGGANVFTGFTPSLLRLSGSNSYTISGINVGSLSSVVVSFYFRPTNTVLLALGSRSFTVQINTGSGFTTLISTATMATMPDGTWSYVLSSPVSVTPGQDISLRFISSFTFLSILGEANYSLDLLRVGSLAALPVTHKNFTASNINGRVKLAWTAMATSTNAFFEVERAAALNDKFHQLAVLPVNRTGEGDYSFIDDAPLATQNFYRVKIVDENRRVTYTKTIRMVSGRPDFELVKLFPSPVEDMLNLVVDCPAPSKLQVDITSLAGVVLLKKNFSATGGSNRLALHLSALKPGYYFLNIRNGRTVVSERIIKK